MPPEAEPPPPPLPPDEPEAGTYTTYDFSYIFPFTVIFAVSVTFVPCDD